MVQPRLAEEEYVSLREKVYETLFSDDGEVGALFKNAKASVHATVAKAILVTKNGSLSLPQSRQNRDVEKLAHQSTDIEEALEAISEFLEYYGFEYTKNVLHEERKSRTQLILEKRIQSGESLVSQDSTLPKLLTLIQMDAQHESGRHSASSSPILANPPLVKKKQKSSSSAVSPSSSPSSSLKKKKKKKITLETDKEAMPAVQKKKVDKREKAESPSPKRASTSSPSRSRSVSPKNQRSTDLHTDVDTIQVSNASIAVASSVKSSASEDNITKAEIISTASRHPPSSLPPLTRLPARATSSLSTAPLGFQESTALASEALSIPSLASPTSRPSPSMSTASDALDVAARATPPQVDASLSEQNGFVDDGDDVGLEEIIESDIDIEYSNDNFDGDDDGDDSYGGERYWEEKDVQQSNMNENSESSLDGNTNDDKNVSHQHSTSALSVDISGISLSDKSGLLRDDEYDTHDDEEDSYQDGTESSAAKVHSKMKGMLVEHIQIDSV